MVGGGGGGGAGEGGVGIAVNYFRQALFVDYIIVQCNSCNWPFINLLDGKKTTWLFRETGLNIDVLDICSRVWALMKTGN